MSDSLKSIFRIDILLTDSPKLFPPLFDHALSHHFYFPHPPQSTEEQ